MIAETYIEELATIEIEVILVKNQLQQMNDNEKK